MLPAVMRRLLEQTSHQNVNPEKAEHCLTYLFGAHVLTADHGFHLSGACCKANVLWNCIEQLR